MFSGSSGKSLLVNVQFWSSHANFAVMYGPLLNDIPSGVLGVVQASLLGGCTMHTVHALAQGVITNKAASTTDSFTHDSLYRALEKGPAVSTMYALLLLNCNRQCAEIFLTLQLNKILCVYTTSKLITHMKSCKQKLTMTHD